MTPIYLDYNATTPMDPRLFDLVQFYMKNEFGNPSSTSHKWGKESEKAVEKARTQVGTFFGCQPSEVFFTSSSTESNNWTIWGILNHHLAQKNSSHEKIHVITSNSEHSSLTKPLQFLQTCDRIEVDFVPVQADGTVAVTEVLKRIKPQTKLLSFVFVNNEIGSVNPIPELAQLAQNHGALFHTDATQGIGKIPLALENIDFLSFSSHKIYGPKGSGVLYVKNSKQDQLCPLIFGGGHERGLRAGTLNVPSIVGLGQACEILAHEMSTEIDNFLELQHFFMNEILKRWPQAQLNGTALSLDREHLTRSPINLSVTFPSSFSADRLEPLGLGVSFSSACNSSGYSSILKSIGRTREEAYRTLRLSFGRWTTKEELTEALRRLEILIPRNSQPLLM